MSLEFVIRPFSKPSAVKQCGGNAGVRPRKYVGSIETILGRLWGSGSLVLCRG